MEKNYISINEDTHFYIDLIKKTYGVCVNIKDADEAEKIIKEGLKRNKKKDRSMETRMESRC